VLSITQKLVQATNAVANANDKTKTILSRFQNFIMNRLKPVQITQSLLQTLVR